MFAQLPMYQQKGKTALNNKLDKSILFDQLLGQPHKKYKTIHVGGTNGKGSSSHMIASMLQEAGFKVGLYTSPHLKDFKERIKINGEPVSEEFVIDFIQHHRRFLEDNELSFFEMTVGMAFQYFLEQDVDFAVIEVGLGGRLDSTNIITPVISLITNIGLDHTHILGDTLEKIALEKAGIIKKGVPVIIGERQRETNALFKIIASQKRAPIFFAEDLIVDEFETDLKGSYQQRNVISAVATLRHIPSLELKNEAIRKGLLNVVGNTGLLGRWQILQQKPKVICDTAHNVEGLELVMSQLRSESYARLHLVLGFVSDKEIESILKLFPKEGQYYFSSPKIARGLDGEILIQKARNLGLKGELFTSVVEAYDKALENATPKDVVYVGGSTFVVAEII